MTVANGQQAVEVKVSAEPAAAAQPQNVFAEYFEKFKGTGDKPLAPESLKNICISWTGAFIAILCVAALNQFAGPKMDFEWLIASFGASAVLQFGLPKSPLAQPRNVIGGHTISALCGIIVRLIIQPQYGGGNANFVSTALGMAFALAAMQATGTTHPPAGATGLLAASADPIPDWQGFKFLLTALAGSSVMVLVALLFNNAIPGRRYPTFW
ncbi:hypothetical protein HYH02_001796 [Chlamydomonas schloesseri]|uniref:HPP transmembrane region domain-containing protein n=1 Tax=Chlamydomonas schloesseri TaxID=2026947 RepID=A0A836BBS9_9CHLO|nr:hypothetical protein HYH02_001796 [Chlamydomonas schloesseri]|eukprot:KAG2453578.1 hypothetical protein HYH02_001796 [Chlamydomonas schloesseri]